MLDSTNKIWSNYSILTNIYNVHTSWHQNHKNYINAKLRLFENTKFSILRKDTYEQIKNNSIN
jgi:UDP-N-acetylmuramoylalanine-D-glutamate ligase